MLAESEVEFLYNEFMEYPKGVPTSNWAYYKENVCKSFCESRYRTSCESVEFLQKYG